VVQILNTTKERRQDQTFFFEGGIVAANDTTPKIVVGCSSNKEVLCSSKTRHSRRTASGQHLLLAERGLQELKVTNEKTALGSTPGEDYLFRICL
jgi:hypothetical protein